MTVTEIAKANAIWQEETSRRKETIKAIDYYNYRQKEYLDDLIDERYRKENVDIKKYKFCVPLTKSLVDQLAICFKVPPSISIGKEGDAVQGALVNLLDEIDINKRLKQADRYAELTHKVGVLPRWTGSAVKLDILTPDRVLVSADPENPTEAKELSYVIRSEQNAGRPAPVNIWAVWTADTYSEVERSDMGMVTKTFLEQPNPYKRIPVAWFSIDESPDTFWLDAGYPIVDLNENINALVTNLDIALDYQSFSLMVTTGLPSGTVIPIGVTRQINIPPTTMGDVTGDAKYITPDAKLETVWKIVQEKIQWFAATFGVSVEGISGGSSYNSGFQLKLSKQGVIDHNVDKQDAYIESVRDTVQLAMDCSTIYGTVNFPTDADITVKFGLQKVETNPLEEAQQDALDIANGIADPVTILMRRNPDMTEDDAIAFVDKIKSRKAPALPNIDQAFVI